jgi:hypothetical protein
MFAREFKVGEGAALYVVCEIPRINHLEALEGGQHQTLGEDIWTINNLQFIKATHIPKTASWY